MSTPLPLPLLLLGLTATPGPARAQAPASAAAVAEAGDEEAEGVEAEGEEAEDGVLASETWSLVLEHRRDTPLAPLDDERIMLTALVRDLLRAAPSGRVPVDAALRAEALGLTISRQGDRVWLHEAPGGRAGLGLVAIRLGPLPSELVLSAPHPFYDLGTGRIAGRLFDDGHARAALFATVQRNAVDGMDPTDDPLGVVQAATAGCMDALPRPLLVQLHGFGRRTSAADVVVSAGNARTGGDIVPRARDGLAAALGLDAVQTGDDEWRLAALDNVQGRLLSGRERFLHIELGKAVRSRLRKDADAVAALAFVLTELAGGDDETRQLRPGLSWTVPGELAAQARGASLRGAGVLEVPSGEALLIEVPSDQELPEVVHLPATLDGRTGEVVREPGEPIALDLRGTPEGLLLPAADVRRLVRVSPVEGLQLRRSTTGDSVAAWDAVARAALSDRTDALGSEGLLGDGLPGEKLGGEGPALPWGSPAARAALAARARAVSDPRVRALGMVEALAVLAPLHGSTHAWTQPGTATVRAGDDAFLPVQGPGTLVIKLRPRGDEAWLRGQARLHLAREGVTRDLGTVEVAGTGQAFLREERFVPSGRHLLRVEASEVDLDVEVRVARRRSRIVGPRPAGPSYVAKDPTSAAELAWLRGDEALALEQWRPWADQPGALGGLARARILALSDDIDELRRVAELPDTLGTDGRAIAVDALLARATELGPAALPPELVEQALVDSPTPDAARLGAWLESLGGPRPPGVAVMRAARPLVEGGTPVGVAERKLRARTTRFQRIEPAPPQEGTAEDARGGTAAGETRRLYTEGGPGVPRALVLTGDRVDLVLPPWPGRHPVLRMVADGAAAFVLDGETWRSPGGSLEIALPAGTHRLEGLEGRLVLLDPELSPEARPAYERALSPLPARWPLPDDTLGVDVRVLVDPPVPLRATLDDGTVVDLVPDARGAAELEAGAFATQISLSPRDPVAGVSASVEARGSLGGPRRPPPDPVDDIDAAMLVLERLSDRIDGGDVDARIERAALLGRLGLLSAARRDLAVVLTPLPPPLDGEPVALSPWRVDPDAALALALRLGRARALADNLAPATPSAGVLGPRSAEAALAAKGLARVLPAGPPAERAAAIEAAEAELAAAAPATPPAQLPEPVAPFVAAAAAREWLAAGDLPRAWAAASRAGEAREALLGSLKARTQWTPLTLPSSGGALVNRPRPTPTESPAPTWQRARDAMLRAPWTLDGPEGEALTVLRGERAQVLRPQGRALDLELFCRDEDGPGAPCRVELVVGDTREGLELADGATTSRSFPAGIERIEVAGPGASHALVLRPRVDGEPVLPSPTVRAHAATPGRPIAYDVAGPGLLRLQRVDGALRVLRGDQLVGVLEEGQDEVVVPLVAEGPARVVVHGSGTVRAATGAAREAADDDGPVELAEGGGPVPPPVDVAALLTAVAPGTPAALRLPARGGSVEVGLGLHHGPVYYPTAAWTAGEAHGDWMLGLPRGWLRTGGWLRGPSPAAGVQVESGTVWGRGHAGLRALAAGATPVQRLARPAGRVGAEARVRQDLGLGPDLDLRLEGSLHAFAVSADPRVHADPRAWTRWLADHPVHLKLAPSLVLQPSLDLRLQVGARATSNTGPSLDRVGGFFASDLLLGGSTVVGLDASVDRRFVDADRRTPGWGGRVLLTAEHGIWQGAGRWWRVWARGGWTLSPARPVAAVGVKLLLPRERSLTDLPPGTVAFRALRGTP